MPKVKAATPAAKKTIPENKVLKKPKASSSLYQRTEPIRNGEIFTDKWKKNWRLGPSIGTGGFGDIYCASDNVAQDVKANTAQYVLKIEPHENGPLFCETHFYHRVAQPESIVKWMADKKLNFLGMPRFISSGSHEYNRTKYRFIVMSRFGSDVQRIFEANKRLSLKSILTLGIKIVDILEYIHHHGYVHADIKGSNLLLGFNDKTNKEVYLVDFGLACRYQNSDGIHKEYKEDPRKAHDGTIEYTSRDAHTGVHSRRGDLEILGYNLLHWACGKLPWDGILNNVNEVMKRKQAFMGNIPSAIKECFKPEPVVLAVQRFLEYVAKLKFDEEPNYNQCRKILSDGFKKEGLQNDGKLDLGVLPAKKLTARKPLKRRSESEDDQNHVDGDESPPKKQSTVRITRKAASVNCVKKPTTKKAEVVAKPEKKENSGMDNPTPAMLDVMRKREIRLQSAKEKASNLKKTKKKQPTQPMQPVQMNIAEHGVFEGSPELF